MKLDQSMEEGAPPARGPKARMHLIVSSPTASRMYDLEDGATLLVGRSPELQVVVDDALVSRLHAQMQRTGHMILIQDRGSANGTWVNGCAVESEVVLRPGDEVKVGATVLTVVETSPPTRYRRDILGPDPMKDRFEHDLVMARMEGDPLVLVLALPGRIPAPLHLVQSRIMELMSAGDSVGHGPDGEILVLKPGDSRQHAEMLVRQLIDQTVDPEVEVQGIGMAVFPDDGLDRSTLIARAREAAGQTTWRRVSRPPESSKDLRSVTLVSGVSDQPDPDKDFIVRDPAMLNLMKAARKVALSDAPVLITGETGSGKEVLARFIQRAGRRTGGPLVKVNCATLPPALIEAELFGHEKGAFTGADDRRTGFLESANLGTLILDEITELPGAVQVKLLRFLDDYTINRVGRSEEVLLDVRVIALTNRDVEEEVKLGTFRQDLYYRLGTFHLYVPPLRSRLADISLLAEYWIRRTARRFEIEPPTMSKGFLDRLQSHTWPGNARELRNAMEAAVVHCEGSTLLAEHLPPTVMGRVSLADRGSSSTSKMKMRKEEAEVEEIRKALEKTGGIQKAAADILGISRRTLWSKIRQYGIEFKKGG